MPRRIATSTKFDAPRPQPARPIATAVGQPSYQARRKDSRDLFILRNPPRDGVRLGHCLSFVPQRFRQIARRTEVPREEFQHTSSTDRRRHEHPSEALGLHIGRPRLINALERAQGHAARRPPGGRRPRSRRQRSSLVRRHPHTRHEHLGRLLRRSQSRLEFPGQRGRSPTVRQPPRAWRPRVA